MSDNLDNFLKQVQAKHEGEFHSVVRQSPDTVETPQVVITPEAPTVLPEQRAAIPMLAPESIWAYFRRPWSHVWRWVLGVGAIICICLGVLALIVPSFQWLYAVAMAAWIPLTLVTFFYEIEITRSVTIGTIALALILGSFASISLTFLLNTITGLNAPATAGLIEEPAKALVLLLFAACSRQLPGILSGITIGVCVGAGFAILETVFYAYAFSDSGAPNTIVLILRNIFSPLMHMAWTGALGGALWSARGPTGSAWKALKGWPPWCVLGGMILVHCLWNILGFVLYLALALWALIFWYILRGANEALHWGFLPRGTR